MRNGTMLVSCVIILVLSALLIPFTVIMSDYLQWYELIVVASVYAAAVIAGLLGMTLFTIRRHIYIYEKKDIDSKD